MATYGTVEFIECTSLNISYDKMGIATVSFTIVSNEPGFKFRTEITAGGRTFTGYVTNASLNLIPNTESWYESHITLTATTD